MKRFVLLTFIIPSFCLAQELNCTVQVVSPQIQDASAQLVFKNMQDAIYQFMNTTRWTPDNFTNQEKIECSIYINITAQNSVGDYNATLQVQSRRPVYKSSYSSVQLNYQDNNIHLLYQLNQPLNFNINTFTDNITSLLAFYANVIIGTDYDSFSINGGNPYFLKAQNITANAQNSGEKGWNPLDGTQTRYQMITNLLDETYFANLRKASYLYHRLGLDEMYSDPAKGRQQVLSALQLVQGVYNEKPANYNIQLFFNAKATEIANIFSEASNDEKSRVYTIVTTLDPTDVDKFSKLNISAGGQ